MVAAVVVVAVVVAQVAVIHRARRRHRTTRATAATDRRAVMTTMNDVIQHATIIRRLAVVQHIAAVRRATMIAHVVATMIVQIAMRLRPAPRRLRVLRATMIGPAIDMRLRAALAHRRATMIAMVVTATAVQIVIAATGIASAALIAMIQRRRVRMPVRLPRRLMLRMRDCQPMKRSVCTKRSSANGASSILRPPRPTASPLQRRLKRLLRRLMAAVMAAAAVDRAAAADTHLARHRRSSLHTATPRSRGPTTDSRSRA